MKGLVLASWAVLFATQILWWGWWAPANPVPTAVLILLCAGPLLLPFHGLLHGRPRSYFWFNLLLMPYFAAAIAALWTAGGNHPVAAVQLAATLAGFAGGFVVTSRARNARTEA